MGKDSKPEIFSSESLFRNLQFWVHPAHFLIGVLAILPGLCTACTPSPRANARSLLQAAP